MKNKKYVIVNNECYYCGNIANTDEHLPPKQIFKGLRIDRITVPSCEKHNTSKSGDDEAIVKAMLLSIDKSSNIDKLQPEILMAINIIRKHYGQVKKRVIEEKVYEDYDKNIVCLSPSVDLNKWIKELSAGMIYYKIKYFDKNNKYNDSYVFERNSYSKNTIKYLIDFMKERFNKQNIQDLIEKGDWYTGWIPQNTYPENLYFFDYKLISNYVALKHVFFKSFTYYNIINISNETQNKLIA